MNKKRKLNSQFFTGKKNKKIICIATTLIVLVAVLACAILFESESNNKIGLDVETRRAMTYGELTEEDVKVKDCDYIEFSAFFTRDLDGDGYAEKIKGTCKEIGEKDTLYINLNVLSQGSLKNGKITLNGVNNFTWTTAMVNDSVVKGNYLGETSSITLQDTITSGTNKVMYGTIESKIGNNINNYSKINSITLTGKYVDNEGNEIDINKTVDLTVDWYGKATTSLTTEKSTYYYDDLSTNTILFNFTVREQDKKLLLEDVLATATIPEFNGYAPLSVECTNYGVNSEYDEETRTLNIFRKGEVNENGDITKSISSINSFNIKVTYPQEAFDSIDSYTTITIPVTGQYIGYNNPNMEDDEYPNPYETNIATGNVVVVFTETPDSTLEPNKFSYMFDVKLASKKYQSRIGEYVISKQKILDLYDNEDSTLRFEYTVDWYAYRGTIENITSIIMKETKTNNSYGDKIDNIVIDNYTSNKGIYFTGASDVLGSEGKIYVYNDETNKLIAEFTKDNWNRYSETRPYLYGENIRHIRIETTTAATDTTLIVHNIKELNTEKFTEDYTKEQVEKMRYIYTYLTGVAEIEGQGAKTTADSDKAYLIANKSDVSLDLSNTTMTTDKTVSEKFTIRTINDGTGYSGWKNGIFLLELPEEIINVNIKDVRSSVSKVQIIAYETYEQNGKNFIKIYTNNEYEATYTLTVETDITANPLKASATSTVQLYAYNENCNQYYTTSKDLYDIDLDGQVDDKVGYDNKIISIIAPSGLLTSEYITNYDDLGNSTIAPNVAEIEKSDETKTATINIGITNNYSNAISDVVILGKIPFVGNTYVLNEESMNSQYTANIIGEIKVPEDLKEYAKIYYSSKENPSKDLKDELNEWKTADEITDWTEVRTYLIDLGGCSLSEKSNKVFSYEVKVPAGNHDKITYCNHAVFYDLSTIEGKLTFKTEPNKVGIQIVSKYSMQLTKNKIAKDNIFVQGATYSITTKDLSGNNITKTATTDKDGILKFNGIYVEREYTLKEIVSPSDYILNTDEIKFKAQINENDELIFTVLEGAFKQTPEVTKDEKGNYLVKANVEDESKYTLKINKTDEDGNPLKNVKFTLSGKKYKTDNNGLIVVTGLYLDKEYELQETEADGYYVYQETKTFKVVRKENKSLEIQTEDEELKNANIVEEQVQADVTLNITNEKIPTYNLQILKVKEDLKEENIENLTPLENARFKLVNEDLDTQWEYTTNADGYINISGLYEYVEGRYITGKYTIQETKAPDGYSNNAENINFQVIKSEEGSLSVEIENQDKLRTLKSATIDDNILKLVIQDKPLFKITKIDSETGNVLANAKFVIYEIDDREDIIGYAKDVNGDFVGVKNEDDQYIVTTDENGIISIPLRSGTYKIVEVGFPDGYQEKSNEEIFKVAGERVEEKEIVPINYIEDLVKLSNKVNTEDTYSDKIVKLMRPLDFNDPKSYESGVVDESLTTGSGFTPIGKSMHAFSGKFDGQGFEISNIHINSSSSYIGLFGYVVKGEIYNLGITGEITARNYIAGIAGYIDNNSIINNCYNSCTIKTSSTSNYDTFAGGITSYAHDSIISNCYNTGDIDKLESVASVPKKAGGIVGYIYGEKSSISNCYNKGKINASSGGGIAGHVYNISNISNSYNKGTITAGGNAGGIVGLVNIKCDINSCYNEGEINGVGSAGGIVGYTDDTNITNCYNKETVNCNRDATGTYSANNAGGIAGKTNRGTINNCYNTGDVIGSNNADCYIAGIVGELNATYIGNCYNSGNISSTYIYNKNYRSVAGGIAGWSQSESSISNCYNFGEVSSDANSSDNASSYSGGIVGWLFASNTLYAGKVSDCYNAGVISSTTTGDATQCESGGIVGRVTYGTVDNCYNIGNVRSTGYSGRILGFRDKGGNISDCFYLETVEVTSDSSYNVVEGYAKPADIEIKTKDYLKSEEYYNKLNVDGVWSYKENSYPTLLNDISAETKDSVEITIENTIKRFKITTAVNGGNGTISGSDENPYEIVTVYEANTKAITMEPDSGYGISNITVNGETIDYTVNENGKYTIPAGFFKRIEEDKHVVVTYSPLDQILIINKVDKNDTNIVLEGAKFKISEDNRPEITNEVGEIVANGEAYDATINYDKEITGKLGALTNNDENYYYIEQDGAYIPNNSNTDDGTEAHSYIKLDLSDMAGTFAVVLNADVSTNAPAWASITEDTNRTYYSNPTGRFIYETGSVQNEKDYTSSFLTGGKVYYIHLGYLNWKNPTYSNFMKINSIKVYQCDAKVHCFEEVDGKYISNNKGKGNTVANSYIPIDLSKRTGKFNLTINAEISSENNYDIGYVAITQNKTAPQYYDNIEKLINNISGIVEAKEYTTVLEGGSIYYVHLGYRKDNGGDRNDDIFTINSVELSLNDEGAFYAECETNSHGQIRAEIPTGTTVTITEVKAPEGYILDSTPREVTIEANKENIVTIENKHLRELRVHHYLKDNNGKYTTLKVAEDEVEKGNIGEEYKTAPKVDLNNLWPEKDADGNYVIPENATGVYTEDAIVVTYYYELEPIELKINHYLEVTNDQLATEKIEEINSIINFSEDGKYEVTAEGTYKVNTNEDYKKLLESYKLVRIESSVIDKLKEDDILEFTENSELTYYYEQKQYEITTEVKKHKENRTNEYTNEKEERLVAGGEITGQNDTPYEIVKHGLDSKGIITATPLDGYTVSKITLVSGESEGVVIYGEGADKNAEISYTENKDGSVTLATFKAVTENKHIIAEFAPIQGTVIVHHYLEGTEEKVPSKDGKVVEDETKIDYVGERYASKQSENVKPAYFLVKTSNNTSGKYIDGVIHVYYYYNANETKYTVHYFYDGVEDESKKETHDGLENDIITEYTDKSGEYAFEKVTPADGKDKTKASLVLTSDESENVINVYYRSGYEITTKVIKHEENYKDGKTKEVTGGTISGEDEEPYESVAKGKMPQKLIEIKPNEGYEIAKIIVKEEKDAEEGTAIEFDKLVAKDGSITLPIEYLADSNLGMQSNKHVEVEFRKTTSVTIKYLDEETKEEVETEDIIKGYEGQKYEPSRKPVMNYKISELGVTYEDLSEFYEEKDNTMYADTYTIIYWYKKIESGIIVRHIEIDEQDKKDGLTLESGKEIEIETFTKKDNKKEQTLRKTYKNYISVDGPQSDNENIIIIGKNDDSKEITYVEDDIVEVRYYYEKQYNITTEVKKDGGKISGQGQASYEKVNNRGSNTKVIEITPNNGYKVKMVKVNGLEVNVKEVEGKNNKVVLGKGYFKDVQEDKHIIVEFEKIQSKVIVKYLEDETENELSTEDEILGYVNDKYKTKPKDIKNYTLIQAKYPSNSEGYMANGEILVKYYYKKNEKVPEKPVIPEEPTEPEKPAEPEKPVVPEKPVEPENPVEPEKPTEQEKPVEPEKPNKKEENEETEVQIDETTKDIPKTGDNIIYKVVTLIASGIVFIATLVIKKRKDK